MPILGIDASRTVKSEKTGVEWYSYFLLRAMQKCAPEGWEVKCYVPFPPPESSPPRGEEKIGRSWQWKVLKWVGRGWTQGRLSLEMMKSPPDVLFVPSHIIPLVHPERTVTTVHDVIFVHHPELYNPKDLESQKRGLEFALKFAKKIIVPSRATRDEVITAGGKVEQIVVVPHGVSPFGHSEERSDEESHTVQAASAFHAAGVRSFDYVPSGRSAQDDIGWDRFILFIGRIDKKKNVMNLIHAFRRLIDGGVPNPHNHLLISYLERRRNRIVSPTLGGRVRGDADLKLVLAGSPGYGAEDIDLAIKTFKLEGNVVQLGYVDHASYRSLLQRAEILVLPSFGEGFGFPVVEAMNAGTPVVCSDIPVLREVGGNAAQYVDPRDPKDIAQGITNVLNNDMLQSEMVRKGKERAAEFTWEKAARQTWGVIVRIKD